MHAPRTKDVIDYAELMAAEHAMSLCSYVPVTVDEPSETLSHLLAR